MPSSAFSKPLMIAEIGIPTEVMANMEKRNPEVAREVATVQIALRGALAKTKRSS